MVLEGSEKWPSITKGLFVLICFFQPWPQPFLDLGQEDSVWSFSLIQRRFVRKWNNFYNRWEKHWHTPYWLGSPDQIHMDDSAVTNDMFSVEDALEQSQQHHLEFVIQAQIVIFFFLLFIGSETKYNFNKTQRTTIYPSNVASFNRRNWLQMPNWLTRSVKEHFPKPETEKTYTNAKAGSGRAQNTQWLMITTQNCRHTHTHTHTHTLMLGESNPNIQVIKKIRKDVLTSITRDEI